MTISDFKKIMQNTESTSVWLTTPSGNNFSVDKNSYQIAIDLDFAPHEGSEFIFATRDNKTEVIKLSATRDKSMSNALTFFGSYEDGIVLEGEIH